MNYLIPANTKRGQLILGIFKPFDLILFSTGVLITIIFMAISVAIASSNVGFLGCLGGDFG